MGPRNDVESQYIYIYVYVYIIFMYIIYIHYIYIHPGHPKTAFFWSGLKSSERPKIEQLLILPCQSHLEGPKI